MTTLRFIAYGDVHHASKAARCLTLEDTLLVESQVHQRVIDGKFDFSVFVGDRYLKREPEDEVKVKSDRALAQCLQDRTVGVFHFHLIGNHDWTKNNRAWHTSESVKGITNLAVFDEPRSIGCDTYAVHALPADVPFDMSKYNVDPERFNLFLFHGIVKGSLMSSNSERTFTDGIDLADIDRPEWDFVLGGDIHVPQTIPFTNTKGGYTGSVIQRDRSDADQGRGWLEITATLGANGWETEVEFVPTRNFFHRETWEVDEKSTFESIRVNEVYLKDQAVEVKLVGTRQNVDRVADDPRWSNYVDLEGARTIEVIRDYVVEQDKAIVDLSQSTGVMDDLDLYLNSDFVNVGTLSTDKICDMVKRLEEM